MKRVAKRTSTEYVGVIEKWTSKWMKRPISEITRADGRNLILQMEHAGLSRNYQKKIKNVINSVFTWAIEFGFCKLHVSPMKGLFVSFPSL